MASTSSNQRDIPELDLVSIARTTRKTLDRLASFSNLQSASDPMPLLTKISTKILVLIHLIDESMLVAQHGYHLATDGAIMCDPQETDWDADINLDSLRATCASGYEESKTVVAGFIDVRQEIYKIAASTKDNMFVVLVSPDVLHTETMKIHLKDIGADLVANLNLLSDFSRTATEVLNWWECVKTDLESPNPKWVPTSATSQSEATVLFEKWSALKNGFQQYYNIIHIAHERYPNLLSLSSEAWKSIAAPRSVSPTSVGHEKQLQILSLPEDKFTQKKSRSKSIKLFFGIYPRKRNQIKLKGKEKQGESESTTVGREKSNGSSNSGVIRRSISTPASTGFCRSGNPSMTSERPSSIHSRSRYVEGEGKDGSPDSRRTKASFSCFSAGQFGEGITHLGYHANGFKMC